MKTGLQYKINCKQSKHRTGCPGENTRGNGKMRKNILKMGAALMAAMMVAATPMTVWADEDMRGGIGSAWSPPTVEAVNGIADKTGCYYEIPSINEDFKPVTISAIMGFDSEPLEEDGQLYTPAGPLGIPLPAAYELRGCYVMTDSAWYNNEWTWYLEGEGCAEYMILIAAFFAFFILCRICGGGFQKWESCNRL